MNHYIAGNSLFPLLLQLLRHAHKLGGNFLCERCNGLLKCGYIISNILLDNRDSVNATQQAQIDRYRIFNNTCVGLKTYYIHDEKDWAQLKMQQEPSTCVLLWSLLYSASLTMYSV